MAARPSQTSTKMVRISDSVKRSRSLRFIMSMIPPPGQNSMRMKTSKVPFAMRCQAASMRKTMLGWPLSIRCTTCVHKKHGGEDGSAVTMMSTSFLTSESMASFGTAMRLRTW